MSDHPSWDPLKPQGSVPDHSHAFADISIDSPSLVQLAESLGGGIYPGMGSGQNDTMPNQDSVAPGFPLQLYFVVPSNQVKQQGVRLSFQPSPYRNPNTASATNAGTNHAHTGDTIQTLSIDHGHQTPQEQQGHVHQFGDWATAGTEPNAERWNMALSTDGATTGQIQLNSAFTPSAGVNDKLYTTKDQAIPSHHDHGIVNNNGGATLTSHTHTSVSNTGGEATHTHPITTGFSSGTSPDSMGVMVDGVDVTSQLGGPFNSAQADMDITPYVAPGTGIHLVQLTTQTNVGRIYGWIRNKAIVNNLGTLA